MATKNKDLAQIPTSPSPRYSPPKSGARGPRNSGLGAKHCKPAARIQASVAVGTLFLGCLALAWWWLRPGPPQMGSDPEVFQHVDALYTATRMHNATLVAQCADRLRTSRENGSLGEDAAGYLDGIIHRAKAGEWDTAVRSLYRFMRAQRRETGSPGTL